ncbi:hypothetical protein D3C79_910950 [compost metagenome]
MLFYVVIDDVRVADGQRNFPTLLIVTGQRETEPFSVPVRLPIRVFAKRFGECWLLQAKVRDAPDEPSALTPWAIIFRKGAALIRARPHTSI